MKGERLAELRKGKHLTQEQFSELMGISKSALGKYERGINDPEDDIKIKFAEFFNVSLDYLMGLTRDEVPIRKNESTFLYVENLPQAAKEELISFLNYLRNRYHL